MELHSVLKALHLFGAIVWIGGIVTVAMAALALTAMSTKDGVIALRGTARRLAVPGMILAWIGGLAMLANSFHYMKMGWFHGKLLFVLIASGLTGVITAKLRKVELGQVEMAESKLRPLGMIVLFIALLTVVTAVLKPGV
jgi:protoporphyrinogen IX oxidase